MPYSVSVVDNGDIDGINGVLTYDSALVTPTDVNPGAGASGYIAEWNVPSAGTLHFVLYENPPTAALDLGQPVLEFVFDVAASIAGDQTENMVFTTAAAARSRGVGQSS